MYYVLWRVDYLWLNGDNMANFQLGESFIRRIIKARDRNIATRMATLQAHAIARTLFLRVIFLLKLYILFLSAPFTPFHWRPAWAISISNNNVSDSTLCCLAISSAKEITPSLLNLASDIVLGMIGEGSQILFQNNHRNSLDLVPLLLKSWHSSEPSWAGPLHSALLPAFLSFRLLLGWAIRVCLEHSIVFSVQNSKSSTFHTHKNVQSLHGSAQALKDKCFTSFTTDMRFALMLRELNSAVKSKSTGIKKMDKGFNRSCLRKTKKKPK